VIEIKGGIFVWEVASGKQVCCLSKYGGPFALSPDGCILASITGTNIRLYDIRSRQVIETLSLNHDFFFKSLAFSPDGSLFASAGLDGLHLWDTASKQELPTLQGPQPGPIAFSPDGKLLASRGWGSPDVHLWEIASGQEFCSFEGHTTLVARYVFSPDGHYLASAGSKAVRLWEVTRESQQFPSLSGHLWGVSSVTFSPDGKFVASGGGNGVCIWETLSGREVMSLPGQVDSVVCSPDGRLLAACHRGRDYDHSWQGGLRLFDMSSGREIYATKDLGDAAIVFSPDGKLLASGYRESIYICEAASGKRISTIHASFNPRSNSPNDVASLAFSPNGKLLASASTDGTLRVWEVSSQRNLFKCEWMSHFVAFRPDGKRLACCSKGGTIRLFGASGWREISGFRVHSHSVCFCFSPNWEYFASITSDGTIHVVETASRREVASVVGHSDGQYASLAFSSDGNYLVSGSRDRSVRLWRWNTHDKRLSLVWVRGKSMALAASNANIEGAIGLSPTNRRLLQQHGAQKKEN
jgi:WD40 repeat protein